VTVTGTPDAGVKNQEPFVTLSDDGGSFANRFFSLTVNDAALTAGAAKSFVAAAAQSSSQVVASFSDGAGAQAAVADFTATIKWGDNTTSAGTVTKTAAGKFDVSGSHTYATAGTKTLTITVVDEEGATVTMSATATVPALPTTGQPQTPVQPSMPLILLALLIIGLVSLAAGGRILAKMPR
jgi:PKD repeat protein